MIHIFSSYSLMNTVRFDKFEIGIMTWIQFQELEIFSIGNKDWEPLLCCFLILYFDLYLFRLLTLMLGWIWPPISYFLQFSSSSSFISYEYCISLFHVPFWPAYPDAMREETVLQSLCLIQKNTSALQILNK